MFQQQHAFALNGLLGSGAELPVDAGDLGDEAQGALEVLFGRDVAVAAKASAQVV